MRLTLFAKAPAPGRVKTRLIPRLGARGAAELARLMIRETARAALRHWPGEVELALWPSRDSFDERLDPSIVISEQVRGDLGVKMAHVLSRASARGFEAVMGCDAPHAPARVYERAWTILDNGGDVVGPARDGGFYFLGVNRFEPSLFDGIRWGGPDVLARLLRNARAQGRAFSTDLPELRDVDDWADLQVVAETWPPLRRFL